jgi:cysteine-rich repeat protein
VIESSEQCDDGNTANGDSCNSTCQNEVAPVCGNGVKEGSEQCDGTALGSCQYGCTNQCTCAPYCGDGITNGNEDCDGTATGTSCDGKCREECACPKQLYLVKINDGGSAALFSNTFTQITSTAYNFRQAIVKTAIVSNGGDTEIIVLNNSHDSWYNPQQLLFIKKDANGNLVTDKELILINGYFVDFAIMDWNGDGWPDLVLLQYTNTVLIYSDISSLSDGSTFNTGQATWVLNLDGDTNHKYSMIKAAYVNGAPTLVAMRVGADGRGRRDFIRYSWDWECKGVTYPAGSASTTAHTKYFNFILPADRVCADFDFIDWNNNKKTEIALMTRKVSTTTGTYWHAQNSVFIYDISKLPNDGSNVNLQFADDTTKTYTWIDAGNLNAGDFWVEDFNGDGKDEFMVAAGEGDIYQYSNSGNTALGTSIPDSTNIRTVVAPTGTFNSGTSTDMAPIDWGYLRIPKIA